MDNPAAHNLEPRDPRRGVIGGIAQLLFLLALLGVVVLWAGRVATHEVSAPVGGAGIDTVAPDGPAPRHLDPRTGALQLDLTPDTAAVLPGDLRL
ncbi:hypothetical protein [Rhodococcus maanshanensis]|uniref:Uncharacterized protein n=1 Tax=Rhodococcus maanshanensis TaxID=183556 RepID=A0A1H7SAE6_9NOCA|nr:hypothetical protein [Rhodococcus maanshanensis]SEL69602.1 hypothetical protein SAMN05444583_11310 [Rhodococcus maanshanensis]